MKIGQALKALRKDLGLTQAQMVKGTPIIVTHYSKMERGENRIFVDDLIQIFKQRQITISYFFENYFEETTTKNEEMSQKLNVAFYQGDLHEAKKIRNQILDDPHSQKELKDRSILIVDVLDQKEKLNEKVVFDFFQYNNWSQNDSAIIILGNIIREENLQYMLPMVLKLIKVYPNLSIQNVVRQRRLATVGINYLFNLRKNSKKENDISKEILKWLNTLAPIPELGIIREISKYFEAIYSNDQNICNMIKIVLQTSGFKKISELLPN